MNGAHRPVPGRPVPVSTYRLQLHEGFGFADAAAIVPYLHDLGVTHAYLSPILAANPGSTHGYDVVDHGRIAPDLGGADVLRVGANGDGSWFGCGSGFLLRGGSDGSGGNPPVGMTPPTGSNPCASATGSGGRPGTTRSSSGEPVGAGRVAVASASGELFGVGPGGTCAVGSDLGRRANGPFARVP